VSIYFINFTIQCSANLIQGGLHSPQDETFDLQDIPPGSDDSPDCDAGHSTHRGHTADPATPTHRQRRAQKAGTRLASSGDDTFQFFQIIDGVRQCSYCL
jgi:hypothetical protein